MLLRCLLFFLITMNAYPQNKDLILDEGFAHIYFQNAPTSIDLQGDVSLLIEMSTAENNMLRKVITLWTLDSKIQKENQDKVQKARKTFKIDEPEYAKLNTVNQKFPYKQSQAQSKDDEIIQRIVESFFTDSLIMMSDKYWEPECIIPKFETVLPDWSKDVRKMVEENKLKSVDKKFLHFSKLLVCLVKGVCGRYMITGNELKLTKEILKNKYESVTPLQLFEMSYIVNSGDINKSLLTIFNVLSYHWFDSLVNRNNREINLRIKLPFDVKPADKFGVVYHFFGSLLYAKIKGDQAAFFVTGVEALGSSFIDSEGDRLENEANLQAPYVAQFLTLSKSMMGEFVVSTKKYRPECNKN